MEDNYDYLSPYTNTLLFLPLELCESQNLAMLPGLPRVESVWGGGGREGLVTILVMTVV